MANNKWFESWFDTRYYHLLYNNRDASEARKFIHNLIYYLDPDKSAKFCDLGCGSGRHAEVVANLGFDVVGLDLSVNNIQEAKLISNDKLAFDVQDMRQPFGHARFDYVLNLFTSFGYFDQDDDHNETIGNISRSLVEGGVFVIDYLNVEQVRSALKLDSEDVFDNVKFEVRRLLSDRYVIKEIKVTDKEDVFYFEERVRLFDKNDFIRIFERNGLRVIEAFGDYDLRRFEPLSSPRLILVVKKI